MIGRGAIPDADMSDPTRRSKIGEPAWEVAYCFPRQGEWSEQDYLAFETSNFPVELIDGCLEFLPTPTYSHQRLVRFLFLALDRAAGKSGGEAAFAPCPIKLWENRIREPDVFYLSAAQAARRDDPPQGADIVIEVLSPGSANRERDLVAKRADYARATISEYWIVDPEQLHITVLSLGERDYSLHGEFREGSVASSLVLPDFKIDVAALFSSARSES